MRTIIVDDELMARTSLELFCQNEKSLDIVAIHENAQAALSYIQKNEIDLIFLDIEMPGMTGLELLDYVPYMPQIVFTTSNKSYAYEAMEYEVTDFLRKPITSSRFKKCVDKIHQRNEINNAISQSSAENEIFVKSNRQIIRLDYDDILYFEYIGDYIKAYTTHGQHIFHSTLKALDDKLKHPRFIKVHRSYIVNIGKIKDIEENTLVIAKSVIPVSRAYKPILLKNINLI